MKKFLNQLKEKFLLLSYKIGLLNTNTTDEEIKAFDFVKAVKVTDDMIYIEKVSNNKEK